jgi:hypothetical protein
MADPLYYDFDGRPVTRPSADDYNLTEYLGGGKTARLYEVAKFCEEAYEIPRAEFDKMVKDRGSSPTEDRLDAADATKTSGKVLTSLMSAKDLDTPEKRSAYAEQLADEAVQAVQAIRLVSRVVQRTTAETGWYARIPPARAMAVLARANHARSASTRGALVVHATITPDCEPPLSCVHGACASLLQEGAPCDGGGCDIAEALYCVAKKDGGAQTCVHATFVPAGATCNSTTSPPTLCAALGSCRSVTGAAASVGTCVAAAADGQSCTNAPCLPPALCIGGTCQVPVPASSCK